jgi:hypothetical protein
LSRREVGLVAYPPEEVARPAGVPQLGLRDPPLSVQGREAGASEAGVAHPQHGVEVAEPADAFLQVGLLEANRVLVPGVALLEIGPQRFQELLGRLAVGEELRVERLQKLPEEGVAPRHATGLGERRAGVQVGSRLGHALAWRAEAVADGQARVPEDLQGPLDEAGHHRRRPAGVEKQQVDVRVGRELGSAVSPEGDHGAPGELVPGPGPGLLGRRPARAGDDEVHLVAAGGGDLEPAEAQPMPHAQALGLQAEVPAQAVDGPLAAHVRAAAPRRARNRFLASLSRMHLPGSAARRVPGVSPGAAGPNVSCSRAVGSRRPKRKLRFEALQECRLTGSRRQFRHSWR